MRGAKIGHCEVIDKVSMKGQGQVSMNGKKVKVRNKDGSVSGQNMGQYEGKDKVSMKGQDKVNVRKKMGQ